MKTQRVLNRTILGILFVGMAFCSCGSSSDEPARERDQTVSSVRQYNADGSAVLLEAAFEGRTAKVREALDQSADPNVRDKDGRTPLMLAAFDGHTEIVRLLLDRGAEVGARDPGGSTGLMYAATGPNLETVRVLLEHGADPLAADYGEQFTALMHAAAEGQTEIVRVLLDNGADSGMMDVDGDTALDFALRNNHTDAAALLRDR